MRFHATRHQLAVLAGATLPGESSPAADRVLFLVTLAAAGIALVAALVWAITRRH